MPKLIVTVSFKEMEALAKLALSELRHPREQAHFLLRQELHRKNLLREEPANIIGIGHCQEEQHG